MLPHGAYHEQCGGGDVISKIVLIGGGEGGVLSEKERMEAQQWQVCLCFLFLFSLGYLCEKERDKASEKVW